MKKVIKINDDGIFVEDVLLKNNEPTPSDCIETPCPNGFYKPKWDGAEWVEGGNGPNPIEYREQVRNQLEIESKPSSFAFECEIGGEVLNFNISDSDRIDVLGQIAMGQTDIEIHDIERKKSSYTTEEASLVMITLATVTRTYKYPYDAKIKALYELADGFTVEDVDVIANGD